MDDDYNMNEGERTKWRNSPLIFRDPSTWNPLQEVKTAKQPEAVEEEEPGVKYQDFEAFESKVLEQLSDLKEKMATWEAKALILEQLEHKVGILEVEKAVLKGRLETVEKELLEFQTRQKVNELLNSASVTLTLSPAGDDPIEDEDEGEGGGKPSADLKGQVVEGGSAAMEVDEGEGSDGEKQMDVRIAKEVEQEDEVTGTVEKGRMRLEPEVRYPFIALPN